MDELLFYNLCGLSILRSGWWPDVSHKEYIDTRLVPRYLAVLPRPRLWEGQGERPARDGVGSAAVETVHDQGSADLFVLFSPRCGSGFPSYGMRSILVLMHGELSTSANAGTSHVFSFMGSSTRSRLRHESAAAFFQIYGIYTGCLLRRFRRDLADRVMGWRKPCAGQGLVIGFSNPSESHFLLFIIATLLQPPGRRTPQREAMQPAYRSFIDSLERVRR